VEAELNRVSVINKQLRAYRFGDEGKKVGSRETEPWLRTSFDTMLNKD